MVSPVILLRKIVDAHSTIGVPQPQQLIYLTVKYVYEDRLLDARERATLGTVLGTDRMSEPSSQPEALPCVYSLGALTARSHVAISRGPPSVSSTMARSRMWSPSALDGAGAATPSCHVSVADRGPGIPEVHLPRLFERFFSYRPGDERHEHLGLGLAIARRIGHGGVISGANRADGGARFDVSLPLSTEAGDSPGTPVPASESVPGIAGAFPPQGSDPRHNG